MFKISRLSPGLFIIASMVFSSPATGQVDWQAIDAIKELSNLKHQHEMELLQKQQDLERERLSAQAQPPSTQPQSYSSGMSNSGRPQGYAVGLDHDSLAGFNPATYRMGNGMVLQVTGLFEPDAPTVCIANCP